MHILGAVHNLSTSTQRHLELILYSPHRAALEHIVRHHACNRQLPQQSPQHHRVIIHAFEQHRLVLHNNAHLIEQTDHRPGRGGQFPGVVEMGDNVNLLFRGVSSENLLEPLVLQHPVRQHHRNPGSKADQIQMVHSGKGRQILFNHGVRQHERIPAGNQNIGNLGVLGDVADSAVEVLADFLIAHAHQPFAEAMTAVHGTMVSGQNQRRLAVLVL